MRRGGVCRAWADEWVVGTFVERDSRKDEAVVFIFIVATAGLLGWAAVKPWVGKWVEVSEGFEVVGRGLLC